MASHPTDDCSSHPLSHLPSTPFLRPIPSLHRVLASLSTLREGGREGGVRWREERRWLNGDALELGMVCVEHAGEEKMCGWGMG
jgi:hypothetical protein